MNLLAPISAFGPITGGDVMDYHLCSTLEFLFATNVPIAGTRLLAPLALIGDRWLADPGSLNAMPA
jgi:hypothetical protein